MRFQAALREVEEKISKEPRQIPEGFSESYIGGGQSKLSYLGLKVPQLRKLYKIGFSFSKLSDKEQAKIWDWVWKNSSMYEALSLAIAWYEKKRKVDGFHHHWNQLKSWAERIDNWAHSDGLSSYYAQILETHPHLVLPTLELWSKSKNPWLRRQSVVSLLYYSSARKKYLPVQELLARVNILVDDQHYYVQKGVGWALREIGNIYPNETFSFLKKNIVRLSPQAFSAATEKLKPAQKASLKKLREGRKKVKKT